MMDFAGCSAVNVERYSELLHRVFDELMISVANILRRDAFFLCTDGYRHAMLVAAANENYFALFESQIAHVDVGRHINARQMSYVNTTVGIWQSRRDGGSFKILFVHSLFCVLILFIQFSRSDLLDDMQCVGHLSHRYLRCPPCRD